MTYSWVLQQPAPNPTNTVINANQVNSAVVPVSQSCIGTNSSGQLIPGMCSGTGGGNENVAYSATPTFSTSVLSSIITLTGNVSTFTLGAGGDGQQKILTFVQGSGNYSVTPPGNVRGFFTIGTQSGGLSSQQFTYYAALGVWVANGIGTINN